MTFRNWLRVFCNRLHTSGLPLIRHIFTRRETPPFAPPCLRVEPCFPPLVKHHAQSLPLVFWQPEIDAELVEITRLGAQRLGYLVLEFRALLCPWLRVRPSER